MSINYQLSNAFKSPSAWLTYFNLLNTLFERDQLRIIHDAKTVSVAITCSTLTHTFNFPVEDVYEHALLLFANESTIKLSGLLDLSNLEAFKISIVRCNNNIAQIENNLQKSLSTINVI